MVWSRVVTGPSRRARVRDDRGTVALEFALVLPILLMLLLGVTTTGLVYSDKLSIANAAREGARFGAAVDVTAGATAWADSVQSRVRQAYYNSASSLTTAQVCVVLENSTGTVLATPTSQGSCGTTPTSPTGMTTGTCVVKVWVQKPATINLGVATLPSFTISARSVAYYGRAVLACPGS